MKRKTTSRLTALRGLVTGVAALAVLLLFLGSLQNLDHGQSEQGLLQLEASLRRAAAACYAAEGIYPPDLSYLTEHYGIQIEEDRYTVFYDIFADNLMPDITVLDKTS